jgi:protocatechuate 3,4-dioxygenase beta subunit
MPSTQGPTSHPSYEGRLLPRPDDEVVDQGLGFDVVTLLTRRRMFKVMGLGAGTLALAACTTPTAATGSGMVATATSASGATTAVGSGSDGTALSGSTEGLVEIPDETNGPYPADGTNGVDVLTSSGIVRSDIRSSFGESSTTAEGIPLQFEFTILDIANGGAPFAGVAVYAWHCDKTGAYSLYSESAKQENYLRGVQIADAAGKIAFTSIFPACYSGRWPHVHFEVYPDRASIADHANAISTSQMALPKNACDLVYATPGYEQSVVNLSQVSLATDMVFGDDAAVHQIPAMAGDVQSGYRATLTVPVDTRTEQTGGGPPAGGGPGGGFGGPPPG